MQNDVTYIYLRNGQTLKCKNADDVGISEGILKVLKTNGYCYLIPVDQLNYVERKVIED